MSKKSVVCWLGFHSWKIVKDTGIYHYRQCLKCGMRDIFPFRGGGYQPVDKQWLDTGVWTKQGVLPCNS